MVVESKNFHIFLLSGMGFLRQFEVFMVTFQYRKRTPAHYQLVNLFSFPYRFRTGENK